jgi:hypothetical protein
MTIKEISIFVQNKKGKLASISRLMGENNLSIRGFTMADTAEGYGIFRLVVDYSEKAVELLKSNNYTVSTADVLAVKIPDASGALYRVLELLSEHEMNLEYIYPVANSVIVMKLDDPIKASSVLKKEGIEVIENTLEI